MYLIQPTAVLSRGNWVSWRQDTPLKWYPAESLFHAQPLLVDAWLDHVLAVPSELNDVRRLRLWQPFVVAGYPMRVIGVDHARDWIIAVPDTPRGRLRGIIVLLRQSVSIRFWRFVYKRRLFTDDWYARFEGNVYQGPTWRDLKLIGWFHKRRERHTRR